MCGLLSSPSCRERPEVMRVPLPGQFKHEGFTAVTPSDLITKASLPSTTRVLGLSWYIFGAYTIRLMFNINWEPNYVQIVVDISINSGKFSIVICSHVTFIIYFFIDFNMLTFFTPMWLNSSKLFVLSPFPVAHPVSLFTPASTLINAVVSPSCRVSTLFFNV